MIKKLLFISFIGLMVVSCFFKTSYSKIGISDILRLLDMIDNDITYKIFYAIGLLDESFDGDGKVTTDIGSSYDSANAVAIQEDGKIVVAGYSTGSSDDFAVVRYNSDGSLDTYFGPNGNGKVTTDIGSSTADYARAIAIQGDGKIVVAGYSTGSSDDFAVVRYNSNGSLDIYFGPNGNGKVTTDIGSSTADYAYAVAIQGDGKIVVAGYSFNGSNYDFVVVRYKSDGSLDTSFGSNSNGIVTTAIGSGDDFAHAVALQGDGKIVVAGVSYNGSNWDFAVVRYNSDGSLDTSFGSNSNGIVTTAIGSSTDSAQAIAIQIIGNIGKIVVAGYSNNGSNFDFAVVRYK